MLRPYRLTSDAGRATLQDSVSGAWSLVPLASDAKPRTVPLGPGEPEVAIGSFADHILVGVVVTYTGSGLGRFYNVWTSLIFKYVPLLTQ